MSPDTAQHYHPYNLFFVGEDDEHFVNASLISNLIKSAPGGERCINEYRTSQAIARTEISNGAPASPITNIRHALHDFCAAATFIELLLPSKPHNATLGSNVVIFEGYTENQIGKKCHSLLTELQRYVPPVAYTNDEDFIRGFKKDIGGKHQGGFFAQLEVFENEMEKFGAIDSRDDAPTIHKFITERCIPRMRELWLYMREQIELADTYRNMQKPVCSVVQLGHHDKGVPRVVDFDDKDNGRS